MGKHSKKNHNPNYKADQRAFEQRSKLCHKHKHDQIVNGAKVKFQRAGDRYEVLPGGQFVRAQ